MYPKKSEQRQRISKQRIFCSSFLLFDFNISNLYLFIYFPFCFFLLVISDEFLKVKSVMKGRAAGSVYA